MYCMSNKYDIDHLLGEVGLYKWQMITLSDRGYTTEGTSYC